jgi:hypothetical protein
MDRSCCSARSFNSSDGPKLSPARQFWTIPAVRRAAGRGVGAVLDLLGEAAAKLSAG